jgi:molybdopterin-guanine dinucleotide biosynthesis protein A
MTRKSETLGMKNFIKNCTGVILAGGENRRMPILKAFIEVEGKKIIERNLKTMKQLFQEVIIITNQPELYSYLGAPLFGDIYNIRGPMTGIFTALVNSSDHWIFVSACDMPFINPELIRYMSSKRFSRIVPTRTGAGVREIPGASPYEVIAPILHNKTEPLFAFYSKPVLTVLEKLLFTNKRSLVDFLLNCKKSVKYISVEKMKDMDIEARSFINLNTPGDVDLYLRPQDRLKFNKSLGRRE